MDDEGKDAREGGGERTCLSHVGVALVAGAPGP